MMKRKMTDFPEVITTENMSDDKSGMSFLSLLLTEEDLAEIDTNNEDVVKILRTMYSEEWFQSIQIVKYGRYRFVFPKESIITKQHMQILEELSAVEVLHNPVYVEIDEDGGLLVE